MKKSKQPAPDILKMIRERHDQVTQQRLEANQGIAPDIEWSDFNQRFERYYECEPMQYEDIGYHDFMMNLKDLWFEMQPAEVESRSLRAMLIGLKNKQVRRDFDSYDDDYDDDDGDWTL